MFLLGRTFRIERLLWIKNLMKLASRIRRNSGTQEWTKILFFFHPTERINSSVNVIIDRPINFKYFLVHIDIVDIKNLFSSVESNNIHFSKRSEKKVSKI